MDVKGKHFENWIKMHILVLVSSTLLKNSHANQRLSR